MDFTIVKVYALIAYFYKFFIASIGFILFILRRRTRDNRIGMMIPIIIPIIKVSQSNDIHEINNELSAINPFAKIGMPAKAPITAKQKLMMDRTIILIK